MDEEITWDDVRKFYVPKEHVQPNYDFGADLTAMMDELLRQLSPRQSFYGSVHAYWNDDPPTPRPQRYDTDGAFVVDGEAWEPKGFLSAAETQESPQSDADD